MMWQAWRSRGRQRVALKPWATRSENVVAVVQALELRDFVKSETAHNPVNSKVWHDSYRIPCDGLYLYLKFAGETLIDVVLTSFKEV